METHSIADRLRTEMQARYGVSPDRVRVVRSPYRICPLGAHIDHQLGPVTAMAIDRAVYLAYAPSGSSEVRLRSLDFEGEVRFDLESIPPKRDGDWGNYARGAGLVLRQCRAISEGMLGVTAGNLGEGGLSSSAAVGVAYLLALEDLNGLTLAPDVNIELDRRIENGYLGVKNGILDPAAILLSRKNTLTFIDCKAVSHRLIPKPDTMPPFAILVAFSGIRQALVATGYNERVEECAQAARVLLEASGRAGQPPFLGNLTPEEYGANRHLLSGASAKRAEHFFGEFERVRRGVDAWQRGDLWAFGRLISESGRSSIESYECGSPPLIDLYDILIRTRGVYGARFSGAGFRGCSIALVDPEAASDAVADVRAAYAQKYPCLAEHAPVFVCDSDHGARIL